MSPTTQSQRRSLRGNTCSVNERIARRFWQALSAEGSSTLYGADAPGVSVFQQYPLSVEESKSMCTEWFLDSLPTDPLRIALNRAGAQPIPGVTEPMLYVGSWRAQFAWHVEDVNLYSINLLHVGAPKAWYAVGQHDAERFAQFAKSRFPDAAHQCPNFLQHKMSVISPEILRAHGFHVTECIQEAGDIMLTFPAAYHCGFNHGFNVAESTNFASANWPKFARSVIPCTCRPDAVAIRLDEIAEAIETGDMEKVRPYPPGATTKKKRKSSSKAEDEAILESIPSVTNVSSIDNVYEEKDMNTTLPVADNSCIAQPQNLSPQMENMIVQDLSAALNTAANNHDEHKIMEKEIQSFCPTTTIVTNDEKANDDDDVVMNNLGITLPTNTTNHGAHDDRYIVQLCGSFGENDDKVIQQLSSLDPEDEKVMNQLPSLGVDDDAHDKVMEELQNLDHPLVSSMVSTNFQSTVPTLGPADTTHQVVITENFVENFVTPSKKKKSKHSYDDLSTMDQSDNDQPKKRRRRRARCGICPGCVAEECGVCRFCQDDVKKGGPGKLKKPCILRRCQALHGEKASPKVKSTNAPVNIADDNHVFFNREPIITPLSYSEADECQHHDDKLVGSTDSMNFLDAVDIIAIGSDCSPVF